MQKEAQTWKSKIDWKPSAVDRDDITLFVVRGGTSRDVGKVKRTDRGWLVYDTQLKGPPIPIGPYSKTHTAAISWAKINMVIGAVSKIRCSRCGFSRPCGCSPRRG